MGRFANLPDRLRSGSELLGLSGVVDLSEALAISATMTDAALKIEALERELAATKKQSNRDS